MSLNRLHWKIRTGKIANAMGMPPQNPPPYYQSRAQWKAQRAQWKMQSKVQRAAYRASYRNYSRGSLVGPLLLVAIGVIALLMTLNRIHAAYFWQWYGHWWPLILIGAGVILAPIRISGRQSHTIAKNRLRGYDGSSTER